MLRPEIIQSAIDLAQEMDRRGLGIVAAPGTELASLVTLTSVNLEPAIAFVNNVDENTRNWEPNIDELVADSSVTVKDPDGAVLASPHAEKLEELVTSTADAVAQHLSFTRTTVMPAVRDYHQRVSQALNALPTSVTYNPVVVKQDLPEPLKSPMLLDALTEYRGGTVIPVTKRPSAPLLSGAEVIEHMSSGNAALDGDLALWTHRRSEEFFAAVWAGVFTNQPAEAGLQIKPFAGLIEDRKNGVDAALTVFMLARRLLDNPPAGTENTLEEWRLLVGDLLVQSAIRLNHGIEHFQRAKDLQQLVLSASSDGQTVEVLAPVYDEFLANGGSDPVLFGSVLSGERRYYVPGIVEKAGEYVQQWERQNRMLSAAAINRRYADAQSLLVFKLEELLAENLGTFFPQEGEQGVLVSDLNNAKVAKVLAESREWVRSQDAEQLEDLWEVSTYLIAKVVFFYTNAYEILKGINAACAVNEGIDPMEAALLSTIEYVTDYVFEQLGVVDL